MSERFFSTAPITSNVVMLDGPEAHHLLHVMRAKVGQQITLFDGAGAEFTAEVARLGRAAVDVRVIERHAADRELPFELAVAVALPKGDRQKWLVEKLTELGVTTLVPLETARGVAQPTAAALERLRRAIIEASKQCGRNRLLKITEPRSWDVLISEEIQAGAHRRLLAHPGGQPLSEIDLAAPMTTQLAIGPEGGFSEEEVAAASAAGWQTVSLGPRILRVETAAVAIAAAIALTAACDHNPPR